MATKGSLWVRYDDGEEQPISWIALVAIREDGSIHEAARWIALPVTRNDARPRDLLTMTIRMSELERVFDFGRQTDPPPDVRAWPISRICEGEKNTGTRIRNIAFCHGCATVGDVCERTAEEWMKAKNFGHGCLAELEAWLHAHGMKLREVAP